MIRIKRLYSFVLGSFLPLLLATFSVCLFIVLMQFLWRYVDDLVGKGVNMKIIVELFFYAANYLFPTALPIAVLLASLMTFGNMGEHLELLAMKSSGISLFAIMKPLIIAMIAISGIAFVYQNNISPTVQTKFMAILYSVRTKSPEVNIPEKTFYNEIPGYGLYVWHKDKTGLLQEVTIYDYSKNFDNLVVTKSDSGRMKMSDDKKYLILTLYSGESFKNMGMNKSRFNPNQIPFQRDSFSHQDVLIEFDSNLNMTDEAALKDREFSKNIPELRSFIQTATAVDDSITKEIRPGLIYQAYISTFKQVRSYQQVAETKTDTLPVKNFEAFYNSLSDNQKIQILDGAKMKAESMNNEFSYRMFTQSDNQRRIRLYKIELHKKFTTSLACFLFFFIGAPLGAIIRKGGIGLPAVISVFLFIVYYNIDLYGYKMARLDLWPVWQGMWLSTSILASLGIFLTYKAVNDSVVMNPENWKENLLRFLGKREIRNYTRKEVIMNLPDYPDAIRLMEKWNGETNIYLKHKQKIPFYIPFWKQDFHNVDLNQLLSDMDYWIDDLLNTNENLIIGKLMDYPVITPYQLSILNKPAFRWSCAIIFPAGILIYAVCFLKQKQINSDLKTAMKVNEEISKELKILKLDYVNS